MALSGCGDSDNRDDGAGRTGGDTADAERSDSVAMVEAVLPDSASLGEMEPARPPESVSEDATVARQVVEDYYGAIDARDYERAFSLWGDRGRASGQTYLEFVAGFAETERVDVTVGEPARIEGAAGSRYVEIPVVVQAVTRSGDRQRFEGSYTLRRTVVDGATPEQRRWHLAGAALKRGG